MAQILIIADTFPPNRGGSEATLEILAAAVSEAGHHALVYTPKASEAGQDPQFTRVQIVRSGLWLWLHQLGAHPNGLINRSARLATYAWLVLRLMIYRNDVVIAGHPLPAGTAANVLKRCHRAKGVIILTYGEDVTMYSRGGRMRRLLQHALKKADAVVTTTEFSRSEMETLQPGTGAKTRLIPPAVVSAPSLPALDSIKLTGSPIVFTLARLVERKGVDVTIEAVALLKSEFPKLRYYIGGKGPDGDRLKAIAAKLGVQDRVIFLGPVDAPDFLFPQADIFCMPNRMLDSGEREGFGMVFLEAGLHGVPSIGGRSGGAVEAVLDGKTGLIVDPLSPAEVAVAIRKLAVDDDLRRELGKAAKTHALGFSRERMAASFIKAIDEILTAGT